MSSVDADVPTCNVITINPHKWNGKTIVMTHGAWHTAKHYVSTFDKRPGWGYDFAAAGYRVLLADYPGTGDSPKVEHPELITTEFVCRGLGRVIESVGGPVDLLIHSMSGPYGLALLESHRELIDHLIAIAPAMPTELAEPPTLVDDLGDSVRVVYGTDDRTYPKYGWTQGTPAFVTHCIGPGSRFPEVDHDEYLASLSPLWVGLSIDRANELLINPVERTVDLSGTKALVMIGTHDKSHPREFDAKLVDWMREHGSAADFLYLGDRGIDGNGHMMMLEENSAELAAMIMEWIDSTP